MVQSVRPALISFTERYVQAYQARHQHLPESEELSGLPSECVVEVLPASVYWQPVKRAVAADLHQVEQGIELTLHPDIAPFYGTQYAADMPAQWRGNALTLLQVWSDEDFVRLQENILGHLVMQRRLKQTPSVFIATTEDELDVIAICNLTGNVIRETLGTDRREVLASDLGEFLRQLEPVV